MTIDIISFCRIARLEGAELLGQVALVLTREVGRLRDLGDPVDAVADHALLIRDSSPDLDVSRPSPVP